VVHRRNRVVVVVLVAAHAGRIRDVVVVVDVAISTLPRRYRVRAGQRKSGAVVIEGGIQPACGVVTGVAGLREIGGHVIRVRRALIVLQMATDAGRGIQVVVVVDVAIGALPRRHGVHAGQRKAGAVVIEGGVQPACGVVTRIASLRKIGGHVVRVRRALIVLEVAAHAGAGVQAVVVVDVAIGALPGRHGVHAGQGEAGRGVVKFAVGPLHRVVALLAGRRKARVRHRRGGLVVVILVAADARGVGDVVVVVDVAVSALPRRYGVRAR